MTPINKADDKYVFALSQCLFSIAVNRGTLYSTPTICADSVNRYEALSPDVNAYVHSEDRTVRCGTSMTVTANNCHALVTETVSVV
jgi:hypothetical protein